MTRCRACMSNIEDEEEVFRVGNYYPVCTECHVQSQLPAYLRGAD